MGDALQCNPLAAPAPPSGRCLLQGRTPSLTKGQRIPWDRMEPCLPITHSPGHHHPETPQHFKHTLALQRYQGLSNFRKELLELGSSLPKHTLADPHHSRREEHQQL